MEITLLNNVNLTDCFTTTLSIHLGLHIPEHPIYNQNMIWFDQTDIYTKKDKDKKFKNNPFNEIILDEE